MIAGLVLAAGASTRMGTPKQLLRATPSTTFVTKAIQTLYQGGVQKVFAITGAHRKSVENEIGDLAAIVHNDQWQQGQFSSAIVGLKAAVAEGASVVVISLVDHPNLRPTTVQLLLSLDPSIPCAIPYQNGRKGHPLKLTREMAGGLIAHASEQSLKTALQIVCPEPALITCHDEGAYENINTLQDLRSIAACGGY